MDIPVFSVCEKFEFVRSFGGNGEQDLRTRLERNFHMQGILFTEGQAVFSHGGR